MELTYTLKDIKDVAKQITESVNSKVLLVYGDMGVGKTTLIKAIVKCLGSIDEVSSPSFSIINEYKAQDCLIYHFDLYRIKDIDELYNFGIEDYLFSNNWSIIEWPEIALDVLPDFFNSIFITLNNDQSRTLKVDLNK